MPSKTFREMKKELRLLYKNKIAKLIDEYDFEYEPNRILFNVFLINFAIFIITSILAIIDEDIFEPISCICIFISCIVYMFLAKMNLFSNAPITRNYDKEIKRIYMEVIIDIFLKNSSWKDGSAFVEEKEIITDEKLQKYYYTDQNTTSFIAKLKKTKIFNAIPFFSIDDCILGTYNKIKIKIHEISTYPDIYFLLITAFVFVFISTMIFQNMFLLLIPAFLILIGSFIIKTISVFHRYSPFRGLVIELDFEKDLKQETFLLERSISSKRIPFNKKIFKEVHLESSTFTEKFQVFSNSQIEARLIFTPVFIEKIINISKIYKTYKLRCHFKKNKLILTINTHKDMFALGSNFKKTDYKTFVNFCEETICILKLIDEIKRYLK